MQKTANICLFLAFFSNKIKSDQKSHQDLEACLSVTESHCVQEQSTLAPLSLKKYSKGNPQGICMG